ncbi:DUF6492 family protein [Falsirhodobacter deserti]|uniref:DUF6492 family protein n=1 Tax=Falsirhodobacter deserti TaxID=1365611 RepID=UPI000FE2EBD1|nr:DUF6492 family protein [Falsirhodobacter deserti]
MTFSLATVVYKADLKLWLLQAKSIDKYVPEDILGEILVIINESCDEAAAHVQSFISDNLGKLGTHANKTRVIDGRSLLLDTCDIEGWRTQQILKLRSYKALAGKNIVITDSKNHFIRPIMAGDFFSIEDDKPRTYTRIRRDGQTQHKWLRDSLSCVNVSREYLKMPATPTTTPFPITRDVLEDLEALISTKFGSFEHLFSDKSCYATEFLMISSFVYKKFGSLDTYFCEDLVPPITLFNKVPDTARALELIQDAKVGKSHTFSIHSKRIAKINPEERDAIIDLWQELELVSDTEIEMIFSN